MTEHQAPPAGGAPRRIAMLIYPGVAPLDVAGPLEVFGVANFLSPKKLYDIVTVGPTAEPVPTALGLSLLPASAMAALPLPVDTLLVSGGGAPDSGTQPEILDWLRQAAPKARRFGSICTGAFALGAAGTPRWQARGDALGVWRGARATLSGGAGRSRPDFRPRRQPLQFGGHLGGN